MHFDCSKVVLHWTPQICWRSHFSLASTLVLFSEEFRRVAGMHPHLITDYNQVISRQEIEGDQGLSPVVLRF